MMMMPKLAKSLKHPLLNVPNFLTLLVLGFITFNEQVPMFVQDMINTDQVKLLITLVLLVVVYYHPVLGVVSFIAFYDILKKTNPVVVVEEEVEVEVTKEGFDNNSPKFEVTLEEEMVSKMVPLAEGNQEISSDVQPLLVDLHGAGDLN